MGPYCQFCNNRCFVRRVVAGVDVLMATCPKGRNLDMETHGLDFRQAENPADVPDATPTPVEAVETPTPAPDPDLADAQEPAMVVHEGEHAP